MSFSPDSKFLVAQLGPPENILHYFAWEKGKVISSISVGIPGTINMKNCDEVQEVNIAMNQSAQSIPATQIRQVTVNPSDGTLVCVSGDDGLFSVYRYVDGVFDCVAIKGMPIDQARFSSLMLA